MRVVLLGANGQLGSDLVERHRESRPKWTLRPLIRNDVDVSHPDTLRELLANEQFDALVNCTGYHKTDDVERNATLGFSVNAHAVRAMAEACESKEAAFFHISTDYVFSGSSSRPYSEMDCPRPINVYGASKAMGEVLAASACTKFFSLRVASLFGVAGSSGKGGNFVETMIRIAREKGEISVVDDITMSPTSTSDVSEWIFRLL
ncbi:MAG: SDR family oxidoreductase, partial [Thermomicrobiales bacterium]